jgi:hypothetical protein
VQQHLPIREKAAAPLSQPLAGATELVEENLAWLDVGRRFIPRLLHNVMETGDPSPKVLELERPWSTRATSIGEE